MFSETAYEVVEGKISASVPSFLRIKQVAVLDYDCWHKLKVEEERAR